MLTKRVNILFDDNLWNLLNSVAKKEKASVGEVVRRAISKVYSEEDLIKRRKKAFETIKKFRVTQESIIDYKALINEGRKY